MAGRRRRPAMIVEIIVLAVVLALVNLLSLKFFVRADLSEGRVFSVSESTRHVLEFAEGKQSATFVQNVHRILTE